VPTSISNIYKVSHMHFILWMCICISPYHATTAHIGQAIESSCLLVAIWFISRWANHSTSFHDWGYRTITVGSHINVKHMKGVSQCSYVVDVNMYLSLPGFRYSHWQSSQALFQRSLVTTFSGKAQHCVVNAHLDPFKWAPTSMSNTHGIGCFATFICC
jgi:hypothetical protein